MNVKDIKFNNPDLLKLALTHRSATKDKQSLESNERLEFLGDAVLEYVVSEILYKKFPDKDEGILTKLRSALVRETSIAKAAKALRLGDLMILGRGESRSGGSRKDYLLANTFEALLGAIYLDQGIPAIKQIVEALLIPMLTDILARKTYIDDKSKLQEYVQAKLKTTPKYTTISTKGPDHGRHFTVVSVIQGKRYIVGEGRTKQLAEEDSARKSLKHIKTFGFVT